MNVIPITNRLRGELVRALRNFKFELSPGGVLFPGAGIRAFGVMAHTLNGRDERIETNTVVFQGINHMLETELSGGAQITAWYLAPFEGNVSPATSWTAANWVAAATEFTGYDEATRQQWVDGGASSQAIGNTANPAVFTMASAGAPHDVYGAALVSASAKSATSGTLFAAALFTSPRLSMDAGDTLGIKYTLSLANA